MHQAWGPAGLLLPLLLISPSTWSGCLTVPKLLSQGGHSGHEHGLLPWHVPGFIYIVTPQPPLFFYFNLHVTQFLSAPAGGRDWPADTS